VPRGGIWEELLAKGFGRMTLNSRAPHLHRGAK
jgi:hypothetical protein